MAFSRLVFTVLVLSASCYAERVPVYLWGDVPKISSQPNPLETIKPSTFAKVVKKLADSPFTVIFAEQSLSVEDLSHKDADGESSFPYLHANLGDSLYLPSVEDPLNGLEKLAAPEEVDNVELTEDGLSEEIGSETARVLIIRLQDAKEGESRADMLRRHNDFMEETFRKLQERYGKVLAVYTAYQPSWVTVESHSRVRRQATANSTDDLMLDGLRLYAKNIRIQDGANTITLDGVPTAHTEFNNTVMNTTLTFGDNTVVLNFKQAGGYWFFESVTLTPATNEEDVYPTIEVYSLMDFSYRCGQNISFSNVNSSRSLTFENLKIQPFFKTTNESIEFGDSFNCVGFFSAPIWSGLFVVFILLAITFYGIMMMLDIRTMDRFDDPKGKTITINTAE